jgi:membrane-associated phospholipid phosphatase
LAQAALARLEAPLRAAAVRARHSGDGDFLAWLALAVAVLGIVLAQLGDGYHSGFVALNRATQLLPDVFWSVVTRFGDAGLLLAISLLLARRRPEIFWALMLAALIGVLYSRGLKPWIDALRPPAVLPADSFHLVGEAYRRNSFPSGHTLTAFVFAGVLSRFLPCWRTRALLLAAATLVGISRVALGVHWPQDVLAGAFGGLLAAWLGTALSLRWPAGLRPRVHLALLLVPVVSAVVLWFDDGGYPVSNWIAWPLGFAVLMEAWNGYWPMRRANA